MGPKNAILAILVFLLASCASYVDRDVASRLYGHVYGRIEAHASSATAGELQEAKKLKNEIAAAPEKMDPLPYLVMVNETTAVHDRIVIGFDGASIEQKQLWLSTAEILRSLFKEASR